MKSPALNRQIQAIFGEGGEERLWQGLERLESQAPELVSGLRRLIQGADATCAQYAFIHQVQSELGGDILSEWNLRSGVIESGRQWKSFLGYEQDALADTVAAWQGLLHPDDLGPVRAAIAAHARGQKPSLHVECRLKTRSGSWRWLQLKGKVSARDEQGDALRLLVLFRDVSEMRATESALLSAKEAAETANRARGAFLANISHEIRTPLNGVIGMTELALDTKLDSEQRHYLKTVKSSAESLLGLLNDILDFSKIEAGKMQFETISFSPSRVLQEAARTIAVGAHKKGLELVLGIGATVPERVVGDPTRLRQVFLNLLGNAIKFTEQGEVEARVDLERQEGVSVYLRCSVRDTGIGIPEARQKDIFDAFSQADSSTTRRFGGTGLGLAICARLVQLMGGGIELDSREGQGSRFSFTARFGFEAAPFGSAADKQFAGLRALVLMPPNSAARELQECLARLGVTVSRLEDGKAAREALEKARQLDYPYQFVFADAALTDAGGLVEQWLRESPPEKLVMLLTHEDSRQGLEDLQAQGRGGCLLKPVAPDDVRELLGLLQAPPGGAAFDLAPIDLQAASHPSGKSLEVLLVEDNPVNQELARRLLEKHGHRVLVANHGGEALDLFEQHRFDVIFMDMQMPVMGGIEATEAIRAREMRRSWVVSDSFLQQVPIIAMTANAMAGDRERCLEAGMNDYLTKPLRIEELERVLASLQGQEAQEGAGLAPPPARALVDFAAAESDLGDRDLVLQMARMLLDEWDGHLAQLQQSLAGQHAQDLCRHAHTLKSLVAIFHADQARQLALDLERATQDAGRVDWPACQQMARLLLSGLAELRPLLEKFVNDA